MSFLILLLFAIAGALIGNYINGKRQIQQIQAGMFYGFSLGCILIIIFEAFELLDKMKG